MPTETEVTTAWYELSVFLNKWFRLPDLHALELALCCYTSHFFPDDDPVWLFVIGPPRTGKTRITIGSLAELPGTHVESDINHYALLSGKRGKDYSMLNRIGSGVLLFKDFTTILSKRKEHQAELVSALREVHDGSYSREVGSTKKKIEWSGKITIIAACTPALERAWAINRDLGDRFMAVRWTRGDGVEMAASASAQVGHESIIKREHRERLLRFMDPTGQKGADPAPQSALTPLFHLSEMVAILRTPVWRDAHGHVTGSGESEGTPSLVKAVSQLARARAVIYRRPVADTQDIRRCQRVIWESVPWARIKVVEAVPDGADIQWSVLETLTGLSSGTLSRILDELAELKVLEAVITGGATTYRFTQGFQKLKLAAFGFPA